MKKTDIIKYITWYASENDIRLSTNRLVKFIYLIDLFHARLMNGKTLTGFPWRFVHYGPYCPEISRSIEEAVQKGVVNRKTYESHFSRHKEYHLFSCRDEKAEELEDLFHIGVIGQLQKAIRKFGDDTPQLLDFVYFETEPMKDAKQGDLLDFSKAEKPGSGKTVKLKKLSPEAIKLAREKIRNIGKELNADKERLEKDERDTEKLKDEPYHKFIQILNGGELDPGLTGSADIRYR